MAKQKNPQFTSPKGTFSFPYLIEPDTQFDKKGDFKVSVYIPMTITKDGVEMENPEARGIIAALTKLYNDGTAAQDKEKGKKLKRADKPWKVTEEDDEYFPNHLKISAKCKHKVEPKDGKPFTQRPDLFLQKSRTVLKDGVETKELYLEKLDPESEDCPKIGGGSIGRIRFEAFPFFMGSVGAGLSLRLMAAMVYRLKEYKDRSASDYGFEADGEEDLEDTEDSTEDEGDDSSADDDDAYEVKDEF